MLAKTEVTQDGQILLRAADLLEAHDWYYGLPRKPGEKSGERLCILDVVFRSTGLQDTAEIFAAGDRALLQIGFKTRDQAASWNDALGRTKDEVVDLLRNGAYLSAGSAN